MDKAKFLELLAKARATTEATKEKDAADSLASQISNSPASLTIDFTGTGVSNSSLADETTKDAAEETAVEVIRDVISNISKLPTINLIEEAQKNWDSEYAALVDKSPEEVERIIGKRPEDVISNISSTSEPVIDAKRTIGVARTVTLNDKQTAFNTLVQSGKSCVLIGAAGTGKTTSMRQVTQNLVTSQRIKLLTSGTKYLTVGKPGAAILSYTRKAVNNIRHAVADEFKSHTLTIHKLLEFAPVFYEIEDNTNKGEFKKTMRFEPQRTIENPLPMELSFLAFEESSMISVELYELLQDAMPHSHQEVFLGDIQQLPPIFGLAVLGFKMLELPVIELTEVYRQALNSPIISLAWAILGGNPHDFSGRKESFNTFSTVLNKEVTRYKCPVLDQYSRETDEGKVFIQIWQKRLSDDTALLTFIKQATTWADQGYYNPEDDIILCPFNKGFGTLEINKGIMQHLGRQRKAIVTEIIAGFNKHYLAVGDRVLYDKEDAVITRITKNGEYLGAKPQPPSEYLDRWGAMQAEMTEAEKLQLQVEDSDMDMEAIEKFLESSASNSEERVQAASHVVHIRFAYQDDDEAEKELSKASEINNLLGGYALTVHKFQGSEAEKVFLVFHDSHIKMISRELLYTAVTRAKKFLHIICETNTFEKGIKSQRIKGDTIEQKAQFFRGEASKRDLELGILEKLEGDVRS